MRNLFVVIVLFFLTACTGTPDKIVPVSGFELDRYLVGSLGNQGCLHLLNERL